MKTFNVCFNNVKTKVSIGVDANSYFEKNINSNKKYFVITDRNVEKMIPLKTNDKYVLMGSEKDKNINTALEIIKELTNKKYNKSDVIVSFGGGVVSDVASFVSSIYKRGIELIIVPTTLCSNVDACLGMKNAVDFDGLKNIIGSFYSPLEIVIDHKYLDSLNKDIYYDGYSEIIKYGFCLNKKIYKSILKDSSVEDLIYYSLKTKAKIVKKDLYDKGERRKLNFGHTIAHAIEKLSNFKISHGKSVAMGLYLETNIYKDEIKKLLEKYNLFDESIITLLKENKDNLKNIIMNDKKNDYNKIDIVRLTKIGKSKLEKITIDKFLGEIYEHIW